MRINPNRFAKILIGCNSEILYIVDDDNMVTAKRLAVYPHIMTTTTLRWTPSPATLGLDNPADWAMEPWDLPPENVTAIKAAINAAVEPSVFPIRRLPTR